MAGILQASFADILLLCRTQLVAEVEDLVEGNVRFIARSQQQAPHFQGERDVLLRPGRFVSKAEVFDGAGRTCTRFLRHLDMFVRTRLELDEADEDKLWLTDADLGLLKFEEACCDALSGFWPEDEEQNNLTVQPLRIWDGTDPQRGQSEDWAWGNSAIRFEVEYLFSLRQQEHGLEEE